MFIYRYRYNNSKLRHRRYIWIPTKIYGINNTVIVILYNIDLTKYLCISSHTEYTEQKLSEKTGKSKYAQVFRKRIIKLKHYDFNLHTLLRFYNIIIYIYIYIYILDSTALAGTDLLTVEVSRSHLVGLL